MSIAKNEVATFTPDEIRIICKDNLAAGLRAIADALDAGEIDGHLRGVQGNGFVDWRDTRAHVIVSIDLAAQVFTWKQGEALPLPPRKPIHFPTDLQKLIQEGKKQ